MVKFEVKANMSGVLDKEMVESFMPLEYEYLHHGVTQLGKQSKFKKKYCIIASLRGTTGVPLVPVHGTRPCKNDKTKKHKEQSQHPFYLQLV